MTHRILFLVLGAVLSGPGLVVASEGAAGGPSWNELVHQIDDIVATSGTEGVAVAMVDTHGRVQRHVAGYADRESRRPVDSDTRFRIGSISKMFVALAVMQLVEQGRLTLDDPLAERAPEVAFDNPWAPASPITLAHLLEHTTGWDAPHFAELATRSESPLNLLDALAVHPHSRRSRWVPGTRTAYNNTGPSVAAYIVEKVSGQPFETYVAQALLDPMGMTGAGYFYTDEFRRQQAAAYRGAERVAYWHLTNRPAGGMHASLSDMASFLNVLLQRGAGVVSPASLSTMEQPYGSLAAQHGMQLGYGLGTITLHHGGVLYHGHEGALPGTRSLLAYAPALGVGHVILSTGEGPAVRRIHELLAAAETARTPPPRLGPGRAFSQEEQRLSGYYRPISPAAELFAPFTRLLPWRLVVNAERAEIKPLLGGMPRRLLPGEPGAFRQDSTGAVALVRAEDPLAGSVLHYGPQTLQPIGALSAYAPLLVVGLWFLLGCAALLFALVWLSRLLVGRLAPGPSIAIRLWPLLGVLSAVLASIALLGANASVDPFALLGRVSPPSLVVFTASLALAGCSMWGAVVCWRLRRAPMNTLVRWHSIGLVLLNLLLAVYLLANGWIGIMLWR